MNLNAEQKIAVTHDSDSLAIMAGAGSGKTTVLLQRAVHETTRMGVNRVLLLAFTRAAAKEMATRLDATLPMAVRAQVQVATIHGHAHQLLRRYGAGNLGKEFSVIDGEDEKVIEREAKATGVNPADVRKRARLLRYGDLLPLALQVLHAQREEHGGSILVDEAQDLTHEEWCYIASLRPSRLTAVGDCAQAIFGWRGGIPDFPQKMRTMLRSWTVTVDLRINYRSVDGILNLANRLEIPGKVALRGVRGDDGRRSFMVLPTDETIYIRDDWKVDGSTAILARTKAVLMSVYEALTAAGVPVHAPSLTGQIWNSEEGRTILDMLQVVANPHSTLHLSRVLRKVCQWSGRMLDEAEEGRAKIACSMWDYLCATLPGDSDDAALLRYLHSLRGLQATAEQAVEGLAKWLGWLADGARVPVPADLSVPEFLEWLASPNREEAEAPEGAVVLSTIHGAKGREWDNVILLGCEEGILPITRKASDIEEERRLFYVAITRAKDQLVLSHCQRRTQAWGRGVREMQASRFLQEVGL